MPAVVIALVLLPVAATAQEGKVRYKHSLVLDAPPNPTGPLMEQLAAAQGEEYEGTATLYSDVARDLVFTTEFSLMYLTTADTTALEDRPGWEYIDTTYVDLTDNTFVEWRALLAEPYLVSGERPVLPWRLSTESRFYLDYQVMKATAIVDDAEVEAWFAPAIPVPAGPGLYGGLPGLILMVTNPATGEVYAAESVDLADQPQLSSPTSGLEQTLEEYETVKESRRGEFLRAQREMSKMLESGRLMVGRPPNQ